MSKTNDTEGFNTGSMVPNLRPSENPATAAVASTHGLVRTLLRSVVLGGVGCLAIAALVDVARPEAATDVRGSGGGTGRRSTGPR